VLKEGFQRQRIAAALYLSLLNPGTPLFEWRAARMAPTTTARADDMKGVSN